MKFAVLKGVNFDHCIFVESLPFVIGRCKTANFIVTEVTVSRNHCQITCENLEWKIEDLSSSGTYVNNKLVGKNSSLVLNGGDLIRLGPRESGYLAWVFYPLDSGRLTNETRKSNEPVDVTFQSRILTTCHKEKCHSEGTSCQNKTEKGTMNEIPDGRGKKHQGTAEIPSEITRLDGGINESANEKFKDNGNHGSNEVEKDVCSSEDSTAQSKPVTNNQSEAVKLKTDILRNFAELLETELECIICSELFVNPVTLNCTHTFCQFCLDQWKKKQELCPVCRKKIKHQNRSLVLNNFIDKMVEQLPSELKERRKVLILKRTETVSPLK